MRHEQVVTHIKLEACDTLTCITHAVTEQQQQQQQENDEKNHPRNKHNIKPKSLRILHMCLWCFFFYALPLLLLL